MFKRVWWRRMIVLGRVLRVASDGVVTSDEARAYSRLTRREGGGGVSQHWQGHSGNDERRATLVQTTITSTKR